MCDPTNRSASVTEVQFETLETIRSLVSDDLLALGDLSGEGGSGSLDESIQRISDVYVAHYDDKPAWVWFAWMELTDKGERVAGHLKKAPEIRLSSRAPDPGSKGRQKLSPENMIRPGSYFCRTALSRDRFGPKYRDGGWLASM